MSGLPNSGQMKRQNYKVPLLLRKSEGKIPN